MLNEQSQMSDNFRVFTKDHFFQKDHLVKYNNLSFISKHALKVLPILFSDFIL